MTGILKRIAVVTLSVTAFFLLVALTDLNATPIQPDVKKLLAEPQKSSSSEFAPARAGWDGPETPKLQVIQNPTLEVLSPAASARAARESLRAAAIPDPRVLFAVLALILLLRQIRKLSRKLSQRGLQVERAGVKDRPVELRPAA